jgi:hypothetical protein
MVQHADIDHTGLTGVGETGTAAHIADGADAHDASAISFSPTGTIAATDVQAAIAEVASEAGGASLTYVQNQLSGDVAMATSGTFYDGPAVTLAVGTWFLSGTITHDGDASGVLLIAKLWDGSTVAASSETLEYGGAANRDYGSISLQAVVVIAAGTPTWKISATTNGNTTNLRAAVGAGNNACTLVGIKIA